MTKKIFLIYLIIAFSSSSCATTNFEAPKGLQKEGRENIQILDSRGAVVDKRQVHYHNPTIYQQTPTWYEKNTWLWVIVGAVLSGVVVSNINSSKRDVNVTQINNKQF